MSLLCSVTRAPLHLPCYRTLFLTIFSAPRGCLSVCRALPRSYLISYITGGASPITLIPIRYLSESKPSNLKQNSQKKQTNTSSSASSSSSSGGSSPPTIKELRQTLLLAFKKKQPRVVIETYFLARKENLEFERSDYLAIFKAFLTPSPGNIFYLNSAAFLVYERIKKEKLWTMDTFRYAVRLFENNNLVSELLELDQIFDSYFSPNAEVSLSSSFLSSSSPSWADACCPHSTRR
jgi:hypothetical protein